MLKHLFSLLAILCLKLLLVTPSQAQSTNRIWWVSIDGSNSNDGSNASPFRNVSFAISKAIDKDTVILKPGAYEETSLNIGSKSLTLGSLYILNSDSTYINNTSIEGISTVTYNNGLIQFYPSGNSSRAAIIGVTIQKVKGIVFNGSHMDLRKVVVKTNNPTSYEHRLATFLSSTIDSCDFVNNGHTMAYFDPIRLGNSTVKNSVIRNNKIIMGVFDVGSTTNIENNKFYDNGTIYIGGYHGNGLNLHLSSGNNRIVNNEFIRNLGSAISIGDYGNNIVVANNTIYGNNRGFYISHSSTSSNKIFFHNNIVTGNKTANVIIDGASPRKRPMVFKNNVIGYSFSRLADFQNISTVDTTGSENNYGFYPQFRDSAKNDFRLSNTSPAISKGTTELISTYDLSRNTRPAPAGSNPDIGAHESPLGLIIQKPTTTILAVNPGNKRDTIYWTHEPDTLGIRKFRLYRSTKSGASTIIADSIKRSSTMYIDSIGLFNDTTYYYRVRAIDTTGTEVTLGNEKSGTPYNKPPKADDAAITNEFLNIGRSLERVINVSSNNSFDADGTIDSTSWFVNGTRVATGSTAQITLKQGTNVLSFVLVDNDGGKDTATFTKTYYASVATTNTNVNTGLSAFNNNNILFTDVTNGTNRIFRVDSLLRPNFVGGPSSLAVNNQVISSPSVTPDSIMFIPNGTSIDALKITGSPYFNSSAALGGNVQVLPTIDTALKRVYLGVDNGMWVALDYSTKSPSIKWSYYSQEQSDGFSSPAVITTDRKLVYTTISGSITGFDLKSLDINNPTPKWNHSLGRSVRKAMAVDGADDVVVVDEPGYINKYRLDSNGNVTQVWSKKLPNTSFNTSVVIDGLNNYYIGTDNGTIVKLNGTTGDTVWTYNSSSSITATPALSNYGTVYFGNQNGEVYALQTETGAKNWYMTLDIPSAVSSHLLHIDGATYFTTATTKKIYQVWDKATHAGSANSIATNKALITESVVNATSPNIIKPVWGGFQGDFRRSGLSAKTTSTFTFTGSGNWSNSLNWENNTVPAYTLPVGHVIIINPAGNGECIIDQPVYIGAGSSLEVKPGKKLILRK